MLIFNLVGVLSIVINVSVCLSVFVCSSVYLSARMLQKPQVQISPNLLYTWSWLGPRLTAMQYVMHFQLCDGRPVSMPKYKTTRMFQPVRQVAAAGCSGRIVYLLAALGVESAVSDLTLLLLC